MMISVERRDYIPISFKNRRHIYGYIGIYMDKTLQIRVDDALYNDLLDIKGRFSWKEFLAEVVRWNKEGR